MFVIICCRLHCIRPLQGRFLFNLFTSGLRRTLLLFDFLRKSALGEGPVMWECYCWNHIFYHSDLQCRSNNNSPDEVRVRDNSRADPEGVESKGIFNDLNAKIKNISHWIRPLQGRLLLYPFPSGFRRTLFLFDFLRKSLLGACFGISRFNLSDKSFLDSDLQCRSNNNSPDEVRVRDNNRVNPEEV